MSSITYCNQNIIHLAYHSDFLYIYHTPEFFNNIDQENARELVAKIPEPFWVRPDMKENKINIPFKKNLPKVKKDLEKVSKLKDFEISSNDDFFSKAIKAAPTLQNKKRVTYLIH